MNPQYNSDVIDILWFNRWTQDPEDPMIFRAFSGNHKAILRISPDPEETITTYTISLYSGTTFMVELIEKVPGSNFINRNQNRYRISQNGKLTKFFRTKDPKSKNRFFRATYFQDSGLLKVEHCTLIQSPSRNPQIIKTGQSLLSREGH